MFLLLCWSFFSEKNLNPENLTLGIVGVGNVGRKVKNIADLLGMRVLLCDPPRHRKENASEFCSLDEIQKEADIITFHVPLNREGVDKTFKMADEAFFDALSKQALIINTSRGEVIDENALLKAMDYEKIAACILDVFENEPEINREILERAFIATPHIAGYSLDGKVKGTTMSVDALYEYFGLKKDYPEISNLPVPNEEHIEIDVLADFLTTLNEIVKHTYNIMEDDERLRAKPSDFEKLRAEYPLRREFQAYSLTLHDGNDKLQSVVQGLGYKVGK
jgi:erythronate-4-phosphate dehydrogenase